MTHLGIPFWHVIGDAEIYLNTVRLTNDLPSQRGAIWNDLPIKAQDWEVQFQFHTHGKGNSFGDGFAFWYVKVRSVLGPAFGSKSDFSGLAIFFDTYSNHKNMHQVVDRIFNNNCSLWYLANFIL